MKFKLRRILLLIILFILCGILVFLGIRVFSSDNSSDTFVSEKIKLNFESRVDKLESFDSGSLYKFGWLQIQGTNIDVPIFDSSSFAKVDTLDYSYGWISQNYNSGENRPVLMGHNILNVSSEPMLPNNDLENFEELMAFSYYGFAKDNLYIQYTVNGKDNIYLIYAAGFYDYTYDSAESMTDKNEISKYIKDVKKNSIYNYDVDVNSSDEIITIKTCTRYFGADSKQQFMIDARKVRDNEEIVKYQVTTNKNFDKLNLYKEKM